jgi:hypothetical protein
MKRDIDFVIAAAPRAGTLYTQRLLNRLGIYTGHERYFNWEWETYQSNYAKCYGDVSWLSVPFLSKLPSNTVILHQTRDPVLTLESLWGHSSPSIMSDERKNLARDPNGDFLKKHCSHIYEEDDCEYGRLIRFYHYWTKQIEPYARMTYDISALQDPYFVEYLVHKISGARLSFSFIEKALTRVPLDTHSSSNRNKKWVKEYLEENPQYKKFLEGVA